jgi:hypothetical protein
MAVVSTRAFWLQLLPLLSVTVVANTAGAVTVTMVLAEAVMQVEV